MILFLIKGLFRDPSRSVFPVIAIALCAFLTVFFEGFMIGAMGGMVDTHARFSSGHVKVMSKGYYKQESQLPNDLALMSVDQLTKRLNNQFPSINWQQRIKFAGLLDIPDENGETKVQTTITGIAVHFLDPTLNKNIELLNMPSALVQGRLPTHPRELLISNYLLEKLNLELGEKATLLTTSADGAMMAANFKIVGTVHFGIQAMDRIMVLADLRDMQYVLNMENSVGEILGFLKGMIFDDSKTVELESVFNSTSLTSDEFSPTMVAFRNQGGFSEMIDMSNAIAKILIVVFVVIISIVIWNTRLIANLKCYGEIGVRLAIGESKRKLVISMLIESVLIGFVGAIIGTCFGIVAVYFFQKYGIDITYMTRGQSAVVMSNVMRGKLSVTSIYIGFIPSIIAPIVGTLMAAVGIYRRQTASLFKELEI